MAVARRGSHRDERGRTEGGRQHGQPELSSRVTQLCSPLLPRSRRRAGPGRPSCLYAAPFYLYTPDLVASPCDELVARAPDRDEPLRLGRVALDLPAQVRD